MEGKINQIGQTLSLLNSMIAGGELHSDQSALMYCRARENLMLLSTPPDKDLLAKFRADVKEYRAAYGGSSLPDDSWYQIFDGLYKYACLS